MLQDAAAQAEAAADARLRRAMTPEEAQDARNPPIGIMAAAASDPRRKSRRCIGFSVMLMCGAFQV